MRMKVCIAVPSPRPIRIMLRTISPFEVRMSIRASSR